MSAAPARGDRALVSDPAGRPTTVEIYLGDVPLACIELDPSTAVGIAADLLAAARSRLGRPAVVVADRDAEGGRQ